MLENENKTVLKVENIDLQYFHGENLIEYFTPFSNLKIIYNCKVTQGNNIDEKVSFSVGFSHNSVSDFLGIFGENFELAKEKLILFGWVSIEDEIAKIIRHLGDRSLDGFRIELLAIVRKDIHSKDSILKVINKFEIDELRVEVAD